MKSIKFIAVALLCVFSLTASAQSIMRIELTDGKQMEIPVSSVNSISWYSNEPEETEPSTPDVSPAGVQAVDLGLPSGLKWANMNIGAEFPEGYGDYFAWGETEPKSKYDWSTYKWCKGSYDTMTKYCTESSCGKVDNKTTLDPEDDAAHVNWGGDWRMPTKAELDELRTKCNWTWTGLNGVKGYKVVGPNGNSIFLPAAGYRDYSDLSFAGRYGNYWSSSLASDYSGSAYYLCFYSGSWGGTDGNRNYGHSVRAVCP